LKKKELAELEAVLAELGLQPKEEKGDLILPTGNFSCVSEGYNSNFFGEGAISLFSGYLLE
jgi:hypothetical protein